MRPAGDIRLALLKAADELSTPERSPTMLELAMHAQVGFLAARKTVENMRRAGVLRIVRTRRVEYRNRPVAEYCTPARLASLGVKPLALREIMAAWSTPIV